MNYYCSECDKILKPAQTIVVEEEKIFLLKHCSLSKKVKVRKCANCGEELVDVDLDDATLRSIYEEAKLK